MAEKTGIQWTESTWTPIRARLKANPTFVGWHCEHASEGCRFCYSGDFNKRLGTGLDFKPGHRKDVELFLDEKMLLAPLRWKKPRMIFVCSMTDLFADFVSDEWIDKLFAVMALCPQHTFQVLTKRSARMREYANGRSILEPCKPDCSPPCRKVWTADEKQVRAKDHDGAGTPAGECFGRIVFDGPLAWPLPNVWLGVSCEDQENADARIPDLLATPAAVRFVSAEPLLGPIEFNKLWIEDATKLPHELRVNDEDKHLIDSLAGITTVPACHYQCPTIVPQNIFRGGQVYTSSGERRGLDWIIIGGESGSGARDCRVEWGDDIQAQCAAAGVACFRKQLGARPIASDLTGWKAPATPLPDSSGYLLKLKDSKGGDAEEWPEHMRVREFPQVAT